MRERLSKTETGLQKVVIDKLLGLEPQYKVRSSDNRFEKGMLYSASEPIKTNFAQFLGGVWPEIPSDNAQITISTNPRAPLINFSIRDSNTQELHSWRIVHNQFGEEVFVFVKGKNRSKLELTDQVRVSFSQIVEHAAHPDRNTIYYSRMLDLWGKRWEKASLIQAQASLTMAAFHHRDFSKALEGKEPSEIIRKSGEPYIEHVFQTAKQLKDWGFDDPLLITVAFGHDIPEDSSKLRPMPEETYSNWHRRVYLQVRKVVGAEAAWLIMQMSKPPVGVQKKEGGLMTKEESLKMYYENIRKDPRLILIKMADRLHNIRTLWAMPREDIGKTLRETMDVYLPMLDLLGPEYARVKAKIIRDFEIAINKYRVMLPVVI